MEQNRTTDENGKPIVRVSDDDPYAWVKGEVRDIASLFRDSESMAELGDPAVWIREGEGVKLEFVPCSLEDRVFHKTEGQIHPNAWAFIRGFEVLMEFLGQEPLSSYKDFKQMYVRMRSPEDQFPFYLNEYLLERFPLHWYAEPVQVLGMNKVDEESGVVVDFLDLYLCSKKPLCLNMLVKWEKEKEGNNGGLKNFFKMKSERELSTSNVVKSEQGMVVNQPSVKKKAISMKRRQAEEEASGKISPEEVKRFTKNQRKLHGYVGSEDLSSVWSEHYPLPVVVEEHFQSRADFDLIEGVGDVGRAQFLQVYAARLLCLGRYEELRVKREVEQKKEESAELEKNMEREKKLQLVMEQVAQKEKELLELKNDNVTLKGKVQSLEKDKLDLDSRVVELYGQKKEIELSKENHGPNQDVHNGALVDDDEVEVEGGGDHDPEA
ncbi:hypothetical protein PIB30_071543 [Stylosanthes scabra]|uniref:Uncharacterized protein n=1 Tax=Stylosanthes scabra TaxID=79078 RepID=A0ABU6XQ35_9FABA|nr:hypothetical protein [Stylosanthes scabra]